jgi:uncharacterized membrane protein YdjX (TVP38/TMEM64 family)
MTDQRVKLTKKIAAALLALIAVTSVILFVRSGITIPETVAYARGLRHVWWLPVAYFALYALMNVLFIPTQPLSVASAVIWGWALGGTIELFAATAGAMFPFFIARWLGTQRNLPKIDSMQLLLICRLVPVLPYTLLNYAAAFSNVTPLQYAAATFVGIIPSTFIFAFFVDAIARGVMQPEDVFMRILVAGGVLALFVVATRLGAARLAGIRRRTEQMPDAGDRSAD